MDASFCSLTSWARILKLKIKIIINKKSLGSQFNFMPQFCNDNVPRALSLDVLHLETLLKS